MKPMLSFEAGRLRPVDSRDAEDVRTLLTKPEVRRFLCDDKIVTEADVMAILGESDRHDINGLGLWMIEAEGGDICGLVGLIPEPGPFEAILELRGAIEPVIALDPRYRGQGLARRALAAVIDYACITLALARLVAAVDAPNAASHRLLRSFGFKECGRTPGIAHDLVLYTRVLAQPAPL